LAVDQNPEYTKIHEFEKIQHIVGYRHDWK